MRRTFFDKFHGEIDMHLGTVVLDYKKYDSIIADCCPTEVQLLAEISAKEVASMPPRMVEHLECMHDTQRPVDLLYCLRACLQELDRRQLTGIPLAVQTIVDRVVKQSSK